MRARDTQNLVVCDSCGLEQFHTGEPIDARARQLLIERDIPCEQIRARRITADDFQNFDWILAMDKGHLAQLKAQAQQATLEDNPTPSRVVPRVVPRAVLALFLDKAETETEILASAGAGAEVLDPYYGAKADFQRMLDDIERGVRGWLDFFAEKENLPENRPQNFEAHAPRPESKA